MLIAASDEHHLFALETEIAHIDVGRHVDTGQMTNMHAAVGIGQCSRDKRAFEFLLIHEIYLAYILLQK